MISTVQTSTNNSGASYVNTLSLSWGATTTSGDFLFLVIGNSDPSATSVLSVTDGVNTWTKLSGIGAFAGNNCSLNVWYVANAVPSTTVVVTLAVSSFSTITLIGREYSGMTTSPADVLTSTVESSFLTSHPTGSTATTAQANELVVTVYDCSNAAPTYSIGGSFTTPVVQANATQFHSCALSDQVVSAVGAQSATWSTVSSTEGIAYIATFLGTNATVVVKQLSALGVG